MLRREHVGRALRGLRAQHRDHALDGLGADALAGADDRDQLVEHPLGQRHLGRLAAQGDLVAAHVDVGVEGLLHQGEVLVAGAEQRDHVDAVGHDDGVQGLVAAARVGGFSHRARQCYGRVRMPHAGRPFSGTLTVTLGRDRWDRLESAPHGRVTSRIARHISSVVPSPQTTYLSGWPSNEGSRSRSSWLCRQVTLTVSPGFRTAGLIGWLPWLSKSQTGMSSSVRAPGVPGVGLDLDRACRAGACGRRRRGRSRAG